MSELSDRGEAWIVGRILDGLATPGGWGPGEAPGDDAAVVRFEAAATVLVCIDTVTEGIHFRLDVSTPYDVGWKAVAVNLSDIAAMGGSPTHVVLAVSAPTHMKVSDFEEIVAGAKDCAEAAGARVVGGDTNASPVLSLTAAAVGRMPDGAEPVLRSGAREGDVLAVTGVLGEAEVGRRAAFAVDGRGLPEELSGPAMRHRRPSVRVEEGLVIAAAGATAMIDISDGLLVDARRLAAASRKELRVDLRRVPVPGGAAASLAGDEQELMAAALTGGEDFELLFTIGRQEYDLLEASWRDDLTPLTVIGEVCEGEGVLAYPEDLLPPGTGRGGFQHFAPSEPPPGFRPN